MLALLITFAPTSDRKIMTSSSSKSSVQEDQELVTICCISKLGRNYSFHHRVLGSGGNRLTVFFSLQRADLRAAVEHIE